VPARSAATCAAKGVDLREPRKPQPPEVAPGQRIALPIGDRDDGVVERCVHVRDRIQHVLADFLPRRLAALRTTGARTGLSEFCFCSAINVYFRTVVVPL